MATFTREGCSANQLATLALGWVPAEMTAAQKAARDWDLAERLDKRGDAYQAEGNLRMADICRQRALGAANRAVSFEAEARALARY